MLLANAYMGNCSSLSFSVKHSQLTECSNSQQQHDWQSTSYEYVEMVYEKTITKISEILDVIFLNSICLCLLRKKTQVSFNSN